MGARRSQPAWDSVEVRGDHGFSLLAGHGLHLGFPTWEWLEFGVRSFSVAVAVVVTVAVLSIVRCLSALRLASTYL
jgi:hypothetical protein